MAVAKSGGLGKGLEALFGGVEINPEAYMAKESQREYSQEEKGDAVNYIDINDIMPNLNQPRKQFDEQKIDELASSIEAHGIIQPIMVRNTAKGYEITAGERRWRAARKVGLKKVPCIIRELTEEQNMLVSIIENMQREDLNPIEESEAIEQLISTYGLTQEQVSKSVGKSRPYITNSLRLLRLPIEIRQMLSEEKLSAGHGRALVGVENEEKQILLARRAATEKLSVREIEKLAAMSSVEKGKKKPRKRVKSPDVIRVEQELKDIVGTKVSLMQAGKKGKIEIEYYSKEELERLIELIRALK